MSKGLIFNVLLPPLVFEAALQLEWSRFKSELPLTLALAFAGVAIAACVVAGAMHWLIGWSWIGAALFGVLIAATDPVSVIAAFRELRAEPRVSMVVEFESLLNDGVAAVGFAVLSGSPREPRPARQASFRPSSGLLAAESLSASWSAAPSAHRRPNRRPAGRDHVDDTRRLGSFLIAEHIHASGIISALCAGLMVGNIGWAGPISQAGRDHVRSAWEYFAFLANSFVFILTE